MRAHCRQAVSAFRRRDEGQVLVISVIALLAIIAVSCFAIDLSMLYVQRHRAQVAADAGSLAGAQDIVDNDSQTATSDAAAIAAKNDPAGSDTVSTTSNSVSMTVSASVPMYFGKLFGLGTGKVSESATSSIVPNTTEVSDGDISPEGCTPESWGGCEYSTGQEIGSGPWTTTFGTVDLQPCNGGGGNVCVDPSGNAITDEVVDLNGSSEGGMKQTVSTVYGAYYFLTFDLTGNPNGNSCTYDNFTGYVQVGTVTQDFSHTNACNAGQANEETADFQTIQVPFTAQSDETTITFTSTTNEPAPYCDYGPEVTDITLQYANAVLSK